jgi:hypothetical protein
MSPQIYYLIFCVGMSSYTNAQTCIIARKIKDTIYIGADSRVGSDHYNPDGSKISTPFSGCKIHSENGFYFATAGLMPNKASEILRKVAKRAKTIEEMVSYIMPLLKGPLLDSLNFLKEHDYPKYIDCITNRNPISVILAHFESDSAALYVIAAQFDPKMPINDQEKIWRSSFVNQFPIGYFEKILTLINSENTWKGKDQASVIKSLIEKEIRANPTEVGLPIDIIKVDKTGYHWVSKKLFCTLDQ